MAPRGTSRKVPPWRNWCRAFNFPFAGGVPHDAAIAHCMLKLFSQFAPKQADYGLSAREKGHTWN